MNHFEELSGRVKIVKKERKSFDQKSKDRSKKKDYSKERERKRSYE